MKSAPAIRVRRRLHEPAPAGNDSQAVSRPVLPPLGHGQKNVAPHERMLSVVGGSVLAIYGVRRRGLGGATLAMLGGALVHRGVTGRCNVYDALGISTALKAPWLRKQHGEAAVLDASEAVRVEETITISAPASALFEYFREPENLLEVLHDLRDGTTTTRAGSGGRPRAAGRGTAALAVEIINEIPDRLIAWTDAGAAVPSAGSVHFEPVAGGQSTNVRIVLEYLPRGGPFGALLLRLINGDPAPRLHRDLNRFRARMERRHSRTSVRSQAR